MGLDFVGRTYVILRQKVDATEFLKWDDSVLCRCAVNMLVTLQGLLASNHLMDRTVRTKVPIVEVKCLGCSWVKSVAGHPTEQTALLLRTLLSHSARATTKYS